MRLMVGHSTKWAEAYGVIEDVQDYNLDKPFAAADMLDELSGFIEIAQRLGGSAELILALEPEQRSAVVGAIQMPRVNLRV